MAATIWLEDFRSNHLWVKQVMVGKSIHPLDSCGDTFTVMETYYIYMWLVYLIYVRVSPLNAVNMSNSSIHIFKLVYSTPCSKEVVYGSLSIVRAIQPARNTLAKQLQVAYLSLMGNVNNAARKIRSLLTEFTGCQCPCRAAVFYKSWVCVVVHEILTMLYGTKHNSIATQ